MVSWRESPVEMESLPVKDGFERLSELAKTIRRLKLSGSAIRETPPSTFHCQLLEAHPLNFQHCLSPTHSSSNTQFRASSGYHSLIELDASWKMRGTYSYGMRGLGWGPQGFSPPLGSDTHDWSTAVDNSAQQETQLHKKQS